MLRGVGVEQIAALADAGIENRDIKVAVPGTYMCRMCLGGGMEFMGIYMERVNGYVATEGTGPSAADFENLGYGSASISGCNQRQRQRACDTVSPNHMGGTQSHLTTWAEKASSWAELSVTSSACVKSEAEGVSAWTQAACWLGHDDQWGDGIRVWIRVTEVLAPTLFSPHTL